MKVNPSKKTIEISASKDASYKSFTRLLDSTNALIDELRNEQAIKKYDVKYQELADEGKFEIDRIIPKNVIINEPK